MAAVIALYLGLIDEGAHVADNPGRLLLGITRPVSQASVDDGHDESQTRRIHSVDENRLQQGVQGGLGVLVRGRNGQQQGLHQTLHLRVPDHTSNLHALHRHNRDWQQVLSQPRSLKTCLR